MATGNDKKPVVPSLKLTKSDVDLLKTIEIKLEAANDGAALLAVWGPLTDVFSSSVVDKVAKDIYSTDFSGLAEGLSAAKDLRKVTLLAIKKDCLLQEQAHFRAKRFEHVKFWSGMAKIYSDAANMLE